MQDVCDNSETINFRKDPLLPRETKTSSSQVAPALHPEATYSFPPYNQSELDLLRKKLTDKMPNSSKIDIDRELACRQGSLLRLSLSSVAEMAVATLPESLEKAEEDRRLANTALNIAAYFSASDENIPKHTASDFDVKPVMPFAVNEIDTSKATRAADTFLGKAQDWEAAAYVIGLIQEYYKHKFEQIHKNMPRTPVLYEETATKNYLEGLLSKYQAPASG